MPRETQLEKNRRIHGSQAYAVAEQEVFGQEQNIYQMKEMNVKSYEQLARSMDMRQICDEDEFLPKRYANQPRLIQEAAAYAQKVRDTSRCKHRSSKRRMKKADAAVNQALAAARVSQQYEARKVHNLEDKFEYYKKLNEMHHEMHINRIKSFAQDKDMEKLLLEKADRAYLIRQMQNCYDLVGRSILNGNLAEERPELATSITSYAKQYYAYLEKDGYHTGETLEQFAMAIRTGGTIFYRYIQEHILGQQMEITVQVPAQVSQEAVQGMQEVNAPEEGVVQDAQMAQAPLQQGKIQQEPYQEEIPAQQEISVEFTKMQASLETEEKAQTIETQQAEDFDEYVKQCKAVYYDLRNKEMLGDDAQQLSALQQKDPWKEGFLAYFETLEELQKNQNRKLDSEDHRSAMRSGMLRIRVAFHTNDDWKRQEHGTEGDRLFKLFEDEVRRRTREALQVKRREAKESRYVNGVEAPVKVLQPMLQNRLVPRKPLPKVSPAAYEERTRKEKVGFVHVKEEDRVIYASIKMPAMKKQEGCGPNDTWAYAVSMMLRSQGVVLSPLAIKRYVFDNTERLQNKLQGLTDAEMKDTYQMLERLAQGKEMDLGQVAALVMEQVSDMAFHEEGYDDPNALEQALMKAFKKENSVISLRCGDSYKTIIGFELQGEDVYFQYLDSNAQDVNQVRLAQIKDMYQRPIHGNAKLFYLERMEETWEQPKGYYETFTQAPFLMDAKTYMQEDGHKITVPQKKEVVLAPVETKAERIVQLHTQLSKAQGEFDTSVSAGMDESLKRQVEADKDKRNGETQEACDKRLQFLKRYRSGNRYAQAPNRRLALGKLISDGNVKMPQDVAATAYLSQSKLKQLLGMPEDANLIETLTNLQQREESVESKDLISCTPYTNGLQEVRGKEQQDVIVKLLLPKGTKAWYNREDEYNGRGEPKFGGELVLPQGAKLTIYSAVQNPQTMQYEVYAMLTGEAENLQGIPEEQLEADPVELQERQQRQQSGQASGQQNQASGQAFGQQNQALGQKAMQQGNVGTENARPGNVSSSDKKGIARGGIGTGNKKRGGKAGKGRSSAGKIESQMSRRKNGDD